VTETPTWPGQALLDRLNGDLNPLHADPEFAALAGLPAPILHGLASYGIVAKAVVDTCLSRDPRRLTGWSVRFAGMLTPGETIRTSVWEEGDGRLSVLATCPERDNAPVLTHAVATTTGPPTT
jgi:acyl dehydratase